VVSCTWTWGSAGTSLGSAMVVLLAVDPTTGNRPVPVATG
jgi:hypothetical protein